MKLSSGIAASALVLTLCGCIPPNTADSPPSTPESSALQPTPASSPTANTSASPEPDKTTAEASTSNPAIPPRALNANGNIEAKVGAPSIFRNDTGKDYAELEAQELYVDFQCPAKTAQPSINGQFIAIRFSVAAQPEMANSGWPHFAMSAKDFRAWDRNGEPVPDPVGSSADCVNKSELLPSPIDPGSSADGLIILDVPQGSGSASYVLGGFEGAYGWEWAW